MEEVKTRCADAMSKDEELESAVKVLQEKGIISSPDVWIKGTYTKNNVKDLIIKVSNYIN